jgi:transposase-like protein
MVYLKIVKNVSKETLMKSIKKKTKKDSVFYKDGFKSYASLHQFGKHNIIKHSEDIFEKGHNYTNRIERILELREK